MTSDNPVPAPSPSTVDEARPFQFRYAGSADPGCTIEGCETEAFCVPHNNLRDQDRWLCFHHWRVEFEAAVRGEEQQAAEAREEAAEERADRWAERSFAVEAALARAEQAERALETTTAALNHLIPIANRAEQAEAQYAVAEAERVDSASLIQRVMKIVGDADGSGIETDEELLEALGRVEARVQGLTDALRGFVDVRPPSMERPYSPADYDEWRILRKDARVALADALGDAITKEGE